MLMHKKFEISVLTTKEAVGKTPPSKHEISYSIEYKDLCLVGPDPKYNTEHTFAVEADARLRDHYKFLNSVFLTHREPMIRELNWTQSDVLSRFKDAKVKKRSKKISHVMFSFPSSLLYTPPLTC